jgi:hypothetical protein
MWTNAHDLVIQLIRIEMNTEAKSTQPIGDYYLRVTSRSCSKDSFVVKVAAKHIVSF